MGCRPARQRGAQTLVGAGGRHPDVGHHHQIRLDLGRHPEQLDGIGGLPTTSNPARSSPRTNPAAAAPRPRRSRPARELRQVPCPARAGSAPASGRPVPRRGVPTPLDQQRRDQAVNEPPEFGRGGIQFPAQLAGQPEDSRRGIRIGPDVVVLQRQQDQLHLQSGGPSTRRWARSASTRRCVRTTTVAATSRAPATARHTGNAGTSRMSTASMPAIVAAATPRWHTATPNERTVDDRRGIAGDTGAAWQIALGCGPASRGWPRWPTGSAPPAGGPTGSAPRPDPGVDAVSD